MPKTVPALPAPPPNLGDYGYVTRGPVPFSSVNGVSPDGEVVEGRASAIDALYRHEIEGGYFKRVREEDVEVGLPVELVHANGRTEEVRGAGVIGNHLFSPRNRSTSGCLFSPCSNAAQATCTRASECPNSGCGRISPGPYADPSFPIITGIP